MESFAFAPAYELPSWPFTPPPELSSPRIVRHPIVIVGAGPSGLTLACDLAPVSYTHLTLPTNREV